MMVPTTMALFTFIMGIMLLHNNNLVNASSEDLTFEVFEDSLDSMAQAYLPHLKYSAIIPGYTTTMVKNMLPGAYTKCPDCNLSSTVTFIAAPTILLLENGENHIHVRNAVVNLTAVDVNNNEYSLLLLDINGTANALFGNEAIESHIPVNIKVLNTSSVLLASYIGDLPISKGGILDKIVFAIASGILAPKFNKDFPGIYLPQVEGASLGNVSVNNLKNNRLTITADIEFISSVKVVEDTEYDNNNKKKKTEIKNDDDKIIMEESNLKEQKRLLFNNNINDGMHMKIGKDGLQKSVNKFAPKLQSAINGLTLPSFDGKGSVDGVSFQYSVNTISLSHFSFSSVSSITFQEGRGPVLVLSGITMSIPNTAFTIKKHMYVTWLSCDGTLTASLSGASVNVIVNITKQTNGLPIITPISKWNWGSLTVSHRFSSTVCQWASEFASYFDGDVNGKIKSMMQSVIPTQADNIIAKYSTNLINQLTPKQFPFDKDVDLDMSLKENPITSNNELEFQFVGKFSHIEN